MKPLYASNYFMCFSRVHTAKYWAVDIYSIQTNMRNENQGHLENKFV